MKPKLLLHKNTTKKIILNQNCQKKNISFGQNHCKVDGPSIPEIIKIKPFHHKLWTNLFSEVGQYNFTAAENAFFTISWHKTVFLPWKLQTTMTNNLHHLKAGIKKVFLAWVWVSSTSNYWARICTTLWPPNQGDHLDRLIYTILYTINYTLYTIHFKLYTIHCWLSTVNCQLLTVECWLLTVDFWIFTVDCQLSTVENLIFPVPAG